MKKFQVDLLTTASFVVEVEAENAEDAVDKAYGIGAPSLCHQCSRIELSDWGVMSEFMGADYNEGRDGPDAREA